ncbi:MAG TPA: hypothetical protein VJV79_19255 [Polyangiaceae bacterium]|nr:hypothetical protein [Polyangiaceae bacterium]
MMIRSRNLRWVVVGMGLVCFACGGKDDARGSAGAGAGGLGAGKAGAGGSPLGDGGGRTGEAGVSESGGTGGNGTGGALVAGANGEAGVGSSGGSVSGGSGAAGAAGGAGASGGASAGGSSGGLQFLACLVPTAIDRIRVQRIDAAAGHCTTLVLQDAPTCHLGLSSGGWCLSDANVSADVAACLAHQLPAVSVAATAVTGTFSVATGGASVSTDLQLTFPASGNLPSSVNMQVESCKPNCNNANDCRK